MKNKAEATTEVQPQPGEPSYEELKKRLAELEAQKSPDDKELTFKVSEKGGVSVYGLGRFPVTLYFEQWARLLTAADRLAKFIVENKSRLKTKEMRNA